MDVVVDEAQEPNDDFWQLSGVLDSTKWTHNPFIVLQEESQTTTLQVHILEKLADVLQYPDQCVVLKQWPGRWRSDFFKLTVGMLRKKAAAREEET